VSSRWWNVMKLPNICTVLSSQVTSHKSWSWSWMMSLAFSTVVYSYTDTKSAVKLGGVHRQINELVRWPANRSWNRMVLRAWRHVWTQRRPLKPGFHPNAMHATQAIAFGWKPGLSTKSSQHRRSKKLPVHHSNINQTHHSIEAYTRGAARVFM